MFLKKKRRQKEFKEGRLLQLHYSRNWSYSGSTQPAEIKNMSVI